MTDQVLILLYTTLAGREALSSFGFDNDGLISEAKTAVAEGFLHFAGDDLDVDKIEVGGNFEWEEMEVDILLIVVAQNAPKLYGHQRDLGKRARRQLRSRFIREGVDAETIPNIQVDHVLVGS